MYAKFTFQKEKAKLELELQQTISERDEAEREADEDAGMLQKQVKAFKVLKYGEGYNNERQEKRPRYPLDVRSSHTERNPEMLP